MASSSTSDGFQDGHPGLPVTVWHGSADDSWSPTKGRRQLRSATSRMCVVDQLSS